MRALPDPDVPFLKLPPIYVTESQCEENDEAVEHVLAAGTLVLLIEVNAGQDLNDHGGDGPASHPPEPAWKTEPPGSKRQSKRGRRAAQSDSNPAEKSMETGHVLRLLLSPSPGAVVSLTGMARVAITGARLLDGTGSQPIDGQTILWEAGSITWIGPDAEAVLDHALLIPAEDGTVLPGLIDSHVHISLSPTLTGIYDIVEEPVARTLIRAANGAGLLLRAGITTARDVGSRAGVAIDVAAAQRDGDLSGARIVAAGRALTPPGGHGEAMSVLVHGREEVSDAVRAEVERGADLIKLIPTGGVLGEGAHGFEVVMTLDEVRTAVETAHELDVHVAAHVHGPEGIDLVLEAGVDTIEHGTGATRDQCERMREDEVALVPTLVPLVAIKQRELELSRSLMKRVDEVMAVHAASVATAIEVGVRVLPGTDAGTPFNAPGQLVQEMELLADLGMSNAELLVAATSAAADTFGWDDVGVLAVGNVADLLLVDEDPLESLATLSWPATIVQDGVVI